MGGSVGKIVKKVGRAIGKGLKGAFRLAGKIAGEAIGGVFKGVGELIGGRLGNILESVGGLVNNTFRTLGNSLGNLAYGVATFRGKDFIAGLKGTLGVGLGVLGGVMGVMSGNPYLVAAAIAYLDGSFNQGRLLGSLVDIVGSAERHLLGSDKVDEYKQIIVATISTIATIATFYYVSAGVAKFLAPVISSYAPAIVLQSYKVASALYSGYTIYTNIKYIADTNERYRRMYEEYLASLDRYKAYAKEAKEAFFNIIASSEMYRYFAGGDLYNSTMAGEWRFAPLTLNEPYAFIMSYVKPDRSDHEEINAYVTGRFYEELAGGLSYLYNVNPSMKWG